MMHQPSGGIGGTASDIQIQAEQILHMKKRLAELIAAQTGQTVEQIDEDADRDRWFTAEEAQEYGFVDHVVAQRRRRSPAAAAPALTAPTSRERERHEPWNLSSWRRTATRWHGHRRPCAVVARSRYILPQFEERTAYGFKRQDPYTKLFEDRIIFLGVQVDDASADDVMAQLLVLERRTPTATSSCTSTRPVARSPR